MSQSQLVDVFNEEVSMNMNLTVFADGITSVEGDRSRRLEIDIDGVDVDSLLSAIGIQEIVKRLDVDDLLDEIGKDAAAQHFDLVDDE